MTSTNELIRLVRKFLLSPGEVADPPTATALTELSRTLREVGNILQRLSINSTSSSTNILNLRLTRTSGTTITIGTGRCRDSNNTTDIVVDAPILVDATASGSNGLDTGSFAVAEWYYVYVIKNVASGTVAGVLSLSPTSPTLPSGFTVYRLLGMSRTESGSPVFLNWTQMGTGHERIYSYLNPRGQLRVLNGGTATGFTVVDCSAFVPPLSELAQIRVTFGGPTQPNGVEVAPTNLDNSTDFRIEERRSAGDPLQSENAILPLPGQELKYRNDTRVVPHSLTFMASTTS